MKQLLILINLLVALNATARDNREKIAKKIVAEATILYRSEIASWYGTDLLLAQHIDGVESKLGGYFSYPDGDETKCIFYDNAELPSVFATITFGKTPEISKATTNMEKRALTKKELGYYNIAKATRKLVAEDSFFVHYENLSLNIIPVIGGKTKKAYIIRGTAQADILPLGGDYLLTFDNDYKIKTKERLHNSYVPTGCGADVKTSYHTHVEGKSPYITVTDVCTLMLYHNVCNFDNYVVMSKDYYSQWSPKGISLIILPMDVIKKIQENRDNTKK